MFRAQSVSDGVKAPVADALGSDPTDLHFLSPSDEFIRHLW
jgi:hypothetical protein